MATESKDKESQKEEQLHKMRHSGAHVLAQAVLEMFPEASLAIGPPIENGFYYDFDLPRNLIPEDLPIIEKKMKQIQKEGQKFENYKEPKDKAIQFLKATNQNYKVEMAEELEDNEVSFYVNTDKDGKKIFVDMCKGPHVESTKQIGYFKLMSIAGAYWRGDEKRKMLQRIYAVSFPTKEELNEHLKMLEEAKKRDHRLIGKKLNLFSFHDEGAGFPFWHPNGMVLKNELVEFWKEIHDKYEYDEVSAPTILNEELWHRSGHWDNYKENMYFTEIDEKIHAVKPMNCPGHILIYKNDVHSYKEFPLRWAELGHVHRHERSGVLHGLFRVRSFTQDDAHHFCLPEQVEDELKLVLQLTEDIYKQFEQLEQPKKVTPEKIATILEEFCKWNYAVRGLGRCEGCDEICYGITNKGMISYEELIDLYLSVEEKERELAKVVGPERKGLENELNWLRDRYRKELAELIEPQG